MTSPHPLAALVAWADGQLAVHVYAGSDDRPSQGRRQAAETMAVLTWAAERGMPHASWPQRHRSLVDSYQHFPPALLLWAQDVIAAAPDSPQRDFCWGVVAAATAEPRTWAVPLGVSNIAFCRMIGV
jgi:hypothetical protein